MRTAGQADFRKILLGELETRCARKPLYSLRAFARDLQMSAPRLSGVLSGKFGLSREAAELIAKKLGYSKEETLRFCDLVEANHARGKLRRELARERIAKAKVFYRTVALDGFKLISDWYHFAIMELTLVEGFCCEPKWIAKRLGISIHEVVGAIDRLKRLDLIVEKNGTIAVTGNHFANQAGVSSDAVKSYHRQILEKAKSALVFQNVDNRDFSSITVAIDPDDLPKAKEMLRAFRTEFDETFSKGKKKRSVYNFSIQLFRLDEDDQSKTKNKGDIS